MKLYGGRFLKTSYRKEIQTKTETRDALIWSVNESSRYADVKIQGSAEAIKAYYPENWEKTPYWLKVGNCVRISHCGGNRGRIEVLGQGILRPTPIAGDTTPTIPIAENAIMSGLLIKQITNGTWMRVWATTGSVRFSGTTTSIGALTIGGSNYVIGMGMYLGAVAYVSGNLSAPSAGTYRYDLIVIGSDFVFDVVTGTAAATPTMPSTPSGHLLCGWILLYPGMTSITQDDINRYYAAPVGTEITMTIADDDLAWTEITTTITITVKDQYGNNIIRSGLGWYVTLAFLQGNGTISYGTHESTTSLSEYAGASASIVFTYERDQLDPGDSSPTFQASVVDVPSITTDNIILRDSGGDPMY